MQLRKKSIVLTVVGVLLLSFLVGCAPKETKEPLTVEEKTLLRKELEETTPEEMEKIARMLARIEFYNEEDSDLIKRKVVEYLVTISTARKFGIPLEFNDGNTDD